MQMEKEVHLICQNCSEHNGAEWRNNSATADMLLGKCHVCGEIKAITHIHYWKNVNSKFKFEVPPKASSQNILVQNTLVPQEPQEVERTQKPSEPAAKGKASQPDLFS